MNNTHIQLKTKTISTAVEAFPVVRTLIFSLVLMGATMLTPSHALATYCNLSASAGSVVSGSPVTLTWASSAQGGEDSFTIDNGVGSVSPVSAGSITVYPTQTTTYTGLTYTPQHSVSCTATVTVTPPPTPVCKVYDYNNPGATGPISATVHKDTATLTIPEGVCPTKVSFTSYDLPGGHVVPFENQIMTDNITGTYGPGTHTVGPLKVDTCNWQTDIYLGDIQAPIGHNGHVDLFMYDLLAGQTCAPPPPPSPTCAITPSLSAIQEGSSTLLSWTAANATSFTIDNGVGSVTPVEAGSKTVSPTMTTTYTGTATGPGGTVSCPTTITVTKTPPPPAAPQCTLSADPSTLAVGGGASTLAWTTVHATAFTIDNGVGSVTPVASGTVGISTNNTTTYTGTATGAGGTITCSSSVTVPPPVVTGCTSNCGGGGGGSNPAPHILFAALPHVGEQPLIYLSQIPYTGLSLGTVGTTLYWTALVVWALALAYLVLFGAGPLAKRSLQGFGSRVKEAINTPTPVYVPAPVMRASTPTPVPAVEEPVYEVPRGYSAYDGFKSFAKDGSLSIDDIVKGLARSHAVPAAPVQPQVMPVPVAPVARNVEPVYEHIEPIYENIEPIMNEPIMHEASPATAAPTNVRGFIAALIEGDRNAVFAGLRQYTRGGGSADKMIIETACLLDDAYRARVDGTSSDGDIARLVARLDTPTLEKLIGALSNAIDSSYTAGVTGAKLAVTRALAVLGA